MYKSKRLFEEKYTKLRVSMCFGVSVRKCSSFIFKLKSQSPPCPSVQRPGVAATELPAYGYWYGTAYACPLAA